MVFAVIRPTRVSTEGVAMKHWATLRIQETTANGRRVDLEFNQHILRPVLGQLTDGKTDRFRAGGVGLACSRWQQGWQQTECTGILTGKT